MAQNARLTVSASRTIDASPEIIYDLISDVSAMSHYSPETVDAGWLDGTLVTESVSTERAIPALVAFLIRRSGVPDRAAHLRAGMVTTLDRLAEAALRAQDTRQTSSQQH